MISGYRIRALLKRFLLLAKRDVHRLLDLLYWPLQDILVWGFTGFWLQEKTTSSQVGLILLAGLVYWTFFVQIHKEVPWNLLDELWTFNFTNLFSTPVEIYEWVIAVMIMGMIKGTLILFFCAAIVWFVYGLNVFSLGIVILPMLLSLMIFGWALGFFSASCLVYYGQKVQIITWIMGWFFAPFVGVFYPITVLPRWAQACAYALPPTYIFKVIRSIILENMLQWWYIIIALVLSCFYLMCSIVLFCYAFKVSKQYGLTRLERHE